MRSKCYLASEYLSCYLHFLILLLIRGSECVLPEATQEGSLHAFKNYEDVATFHYTVPKEVLKATWKFGAFMDVEECPPREVHIHLQWGSYPVISANNATFPPHMYPNRDGMISVTTMTSFDTQISTVVPIYGPEPGDWFVAAYLSHWDEKVQQKGLGHKCHYSIGSVAIWTQSNGIQDIPIGYQKTLHTSEPKSYYKIYIPSGVWHFRVDVWSCNFTLRTYKDKDPTCIKGLALKGRALPVFNHTHPTPIGNLTSKDSYTFTELSPYEDSYYYLMVISDSVIDFQIRVSISECPIRVIEKSPMSKYLDAPLFSEMLPDLHSGNIRLQDLIKDRTAHQSSLNNISFQYSSLKSSQEQFDLPDDDTAKGDPCIPRFQLVRIKHSQAFSGVYLLKQREWLTSWIRLTDSHPVIVQFDILPLVDIGGTLSIEVHLEMDKLLSEQLVLVSVCIRNSRVPDRVNGQITCGDQNMSMDLSSNGYQNETLLIPYPQPGTWHIALYARCYVNGFLSNCAMEEVLVSVDVRTRQCVFSGNNQCGEHGVCQETNRGLLYYTSCNCFGGFRGWGCTDATQAEPRASLMLNTMMLTLSNGFFLPAIYLAAQRKLYTEALVYFATMLCSSLYHTCDQKFMTYCIAKYEVLQYMDFFSSILGFWMTLVAMAELPVQFVSLFHMFGVFIIAFGVESDKTGLFSILVPLAIGVTIPIGAYAYRCYISKRWMLPRRKVKVTTGLILACSGLVLYCSVETEANYYYIHSTWHTIIALSLLFLLPPARPEPSRSSIEDSPSESDSELLDYKHIPSSPVFTIVSEQD